MKKINNFIDGKSIKSISDKYLDVNDPSTGEVISQVILSNQNDYNDYRFILRCNYYIYSSKDFRFQEKPHIEMQSLEMYISKEDLLKDPYTIMYETLKMIYEDNTDDI